jgi:lipopolysaccharide/colanic/teichoic acid biosynthesis glycosyltransferase
MLVRTDSGSDTPAARPGPLGPLPDAGAYGRVKAVTDRVFALVLLVLTSPLVLLAAVLVKVTSPGPFLYSQIRLGRGGRPFRIYKVRTMHHNCEQQSGARWCVPGDARITPVGRFLRKTHIDELPQLLNVLRGDMSLVGPRPERPEFVPELELALPRYRERLLVRPGLSGLAQVQLPPDSDLESVRRKLAHDLYYVEQATLWLDLLVLLSTGLHVLGLPYAVTAWAFALPGGDVVERAYASGLAKEAGRPKPAAGPQTPAVVDFQPA